MSERAANRGLIIIVAIYVVLATLYSLIVPPFEASDELWHYPMVKYMSDNGLQIPLQDPAVQTAWRQEGSQPPFYYMAAAVLTSWIDTSDLETWRRVNPHADIGVLRPDGNANMMVHRPDEPTNRFTGALLALQISRFFSVLLGAATVVVTYALGRALFPDHPLIALIAAGFNAVLPMFLFISGSVNNDNLSNLLGNLLTLLIVRLLLDRDRPSWRTYALLGLATGAGILSKLSLGFFIPLVALTLLIMSLRRKDWRPLILGGLISGGLTIVIAGGWYLRNWQLYGDPTGLNVFLDIVGRRAIPANAAQLWSERDSYLQAFWGFFGGMNVPMSAPIYTLYNIVAIGGMVSAILFVLWQMTRRESVQRHTMGLAHGVTLLWIIVTFVSYLRWTAETPASQGRLVFVALSSICVWLAVGWTWWLPRGLKLGGALPVAYSAVVAVAAPFLFIQPAYRPPSQPETLSFTIEDEAAPNAAFSDGSGTLSIYLPEGTGGILNPSARPESYVELGMLIRSRGTFTRDWSLFVHLVTPDGVIIGQRDIYPGGGHLATSDLQPGATWYNPAAVWVPSNAYAPQTLDVVIGWYDLRTGERMTLGDGSETYRIGSVELLPRESALDVPNPMAANFARQIELVGYELSDLSPAQSQEVTLTLYWRGLEQLAVDYVVFAQIIDRATTTIYAASDAMPAAWTRPTTTWNPGEVVTDAHTLTVNRNAPPGIYDIYVGLYTQGEDGSFNRLRVVTPDGGEAFDYIELTRVRIVPEDAS